MTGMVLLVVGSDPGRYRAALTFAMAACALGTEATVHLHDEAVSLLCNDNPLLPEALDAGVDVSFCQSGLASANLSADTLDPRLSPGGPVSVLATLGDRRLIVF